MIITRTITAAVGATFLLNAVPVLAQSANPLSASARTQFETLSGFVARSAERVPENLFSFRPTPEVRTFAQLFGHIADAYFSMCAIAAGVEPPRSGIEKGVTSKAELAKALNDGSTYCKSVMDGMTDLRGAEAVEFFFGPTPRLGVLFFVSAHTYEHYGNLVTYMRLNKIVPPSSVGTGPAVAAAR